LITIADAGLGNFASIANMLDFLEIDVEIRKSPGEIESITHLILPGVGSFDAGMELLDSSGWTGAINSLPSETKILGICLGMQLLTEGSEEGVRPGLGLIPGKCKRFDSGLGQVPHLGWNTLNVIKGNNIFPEDSKIRRFYFAHSYFVELSDQSVAFGETHYMKSFTSAFASQNIYGFQFHPEKSHQFGMEALENFSRL
jgi:glutamine amidotransferase